MGSPPSRGAADYWSPGDWNIICSICGTKMKFSQAVQNWQGQWRHPRCNEPRHPQDFVHAINSQEMAIPSPQKMGEAYIPFNPQFFAKAVPASVSGPAFSPEMATQTGSIMETQGGVPMELENTGTVTTLAVTIMFPDWVDLQSVQWSWASGGGGIAINSPTSPITSFTGGMAGLNGVAQCLLTSTLGATALVQVEVST